MNFDIKKDDVEEKFVRSGGKGGQNVNKVSTCVQLKHIPTGLTVRCEVHRTQNKNRELARQILKKKLDKIHQEKLQSIESDYEKRKRQTRRKPRAIKEEILRIKKINSEKKNFRKKVGIDIHN